MKALTLTQPWATLVALQAKRVETRSWQREHHGPLAIHAAKALPASWAPFRKWPFLSALGPLVGMNDQGAPNIDRLPRGAVIAVCEIAWIMPTESVRDTLGQWSEHRDVELAFGDYSDGRYAWGLTAIRALDEPIPCRGMLGLWELPPEVTAALEDIS